MDKQVTTKDLDPELWKIFDEYVHGFIDRRGFMDRAGKYAVGGLTAAGILDLMNPKFAEAQQVARDDPRIVTHSLEFASPQGYGKMRGLLAMRTFAVLCGLGGLFQVLDLLETSTDILSRGQGFAGILHYTFLRSPSVLLQALPLAALLGAIFSFSTLSRQNEICAMRAAGLPFRRVLLALLPTAIVIGLAHGALAELIVPKAQKSLTAWWASLPPSPDKDPDTELLWFRTGGAVVGVATVMPDGRRLDEVRIFSGQFGQVK